MPIFLYNERLCTDSKIPGASFSVIIMAVFKLHRRGVFCNVPPRLFVICFVTFILYILLTHLTIFHSALTYDALTQGAISFPTSIHKHLVVASLRNENTSWLFENFPEWHKSIYVVDDPTAPLTVMRNKGREAMVYLRCVSRPVGHAVVDFLNH